MIIFLILWVIFLYPVSFRPPPHARSHGSCQLWARGLSSCQGSPSPANTWQVFMIHGICLLLIISPIKHFMDIFRRCGENRLIRLTSEPRLEFYLDVLENTFRYFVINTFMSAGDLAVIWVWVRRCKDKCASSQKSDLWSMVQQIILASGRCQM